MKKPLAAVLCSALLGAACSLLAPKLTRPDISVVGVELRRGNLLQQDFAVKLNVQNPNDRPLPVHGLHVELHVGGDEIASGVSDRAFTVPAHGESEFDMTVKANLALAILTLADHANRRDDSVAYEVTGSASLDLPFLHDLPFRQSGSFSLQGQGH